MAESPCGGVDTWLKTIDPSLSSQVLWGPEVPTGVVRLLCELCYVVDWSGIRSWFPKYWVGTRGWIVVSDGRARFRLNSMLSVVKPWVVDAGTRRRVRAALLLTTRSSGARSAFETRDLPHNAEPGMRSARVLEIPIKLWNNFCTFYHREDNIATFGWKNLISEVFMHADFYYINKYGNPIYIANDTAHF